MRKLLVAATILFLITLFAAAASEATIPPADSGVKSYTISYKANNGKPRKAILLLPGWYSKKRHPSIPLVISPHGRGITPDGNRSYWGNLPAEGFAVINPEGQGRFYSLDSWGYTRQIADLARMPSVIHSSMKWVRINNKKIYALGGSMGGQETLLLAARYPKLLAGAIAFDPAIDMSLRYRDFASLGVPGLKLRARMKKEFKGTPITNPGEYLIRSPISYTYALSYLRFPVQIWWSHCDQIILDEDEQVSNLTGRMKTINPQVNLQTFVGRWRHSESQRAFMPYALAMFGLMKPPDNNLDTKLRSYDRC